MKKLLLTAVLVVVLVVGIMLLAPSGGVLGGAVTITSIDASAGQPTGRAMLSIAIRRESDDSLLLNAAVDANTNGSYEADEWVVKNMPAYTRPDWSDNFAFALKNPSTTSLPVMVLLGQTPITSFAATDEMEQVTVSAPIEHQVIGDLLDLSSVTNPTESMKAGQTVVRQPKPEGVPNTFHSDTPDLPQRKDECAPTSAANSIIRLAGDHNRIDAIPRDPQELIDLLKGQMGWTSQNGVLVGDFSPGKEAVAQKLNLPITSETVTGDPGHIVDRIDDTMTAGGAAEIRIQSSYLGTDGKVHIVGGHMVTVVNVVRDGQLTSLQIHDPLSPSGTDTYQLDSDGNLIGYPYLGGDKSDAIHVQVKAGFLQQWIEENDQSVLNDIREVKERAWVKVIDVDGHKIPLSEVQVEGPGTCPDDHYHASRGGVAKALDGTMVPDSAPQHCGFGKVSEKPVQECTPDGKECR